MCAPVSYSAPACLAAQGWSQQSVLVVERNESFACDSAFYREGCSACGVVVTRLTCRSTRRASEEARQSLHIKSNLTVGTWSRCVSKCECVCFSTLAGWVALETGEKQKVSHRLQSCFHASTSLCLSESCCREKSTVVIILTYPRH